MSQTEMHITNKLKNKTTGHNYEYPMIAIQNSYVVNLSALEPGIILLKYV